MRALDARIERALRGDGGDAEAAWLAAWLVASGRGSAARARRCRDVERLVAAARTLDVTPGPRRPSAREIVARAARAPN